MDKANKITYMYVLFLQYHEEAERDNTIKLISIFHTEDEAVKYASEESMCRYAHIECIDIGEEFMYDQDRHNCILCKAEEQRQKENYEREYNFMVEVCTSSQKYH